MHCASGLHATPVCHAQQDRHLHAGKTSSCFSTRQPFSSSNGAFQKGSSVSNKCSPQSQAARHAKLPLCIRNAVVGAAASEKMTVAITGTTIPRLPSLRLTSSEFLLFGLFVRRNSGNLERGGARKHRHHASGVSPEAMRCSLE